MEANGAHRILKSRSPSLMIVISPSQNFEEYPEHRTHFFYLLQAVNSQCFPAFLSIPPAQFKLVLDSIIWAFKHTMRNVADTGAWRTRVRATVAFSFKLICAWKNIPTLHYSVNAKGFQLHLIHKCFWMQFVWLLSMFLTLGLLVSHAT